MKYYIYNQADESWFYMWDENEDGFIWTFKKSKAYDFKNYKKAKSMLDVLISRGEVVNIITE